MIQIADVEKCEDIHQITAKKKTLDMGTTFIKITDTKLSPKMLKSLGKYVRPPSPCHAYAIYLRCNRW